MSETIAPLTLAVHTVGRNTRDELVADVRAGLAATPKHLPPRWFYDERGSQLFDAITGLPEYYQTRTEAAILEAHVGEITRSVRPRSIVELGAGSCAKSRILIQSALLQGSLTTFVPFDISESMLRCAAADLLDRFPGLTVHAMVGDFSHHLAAIPRLGRQLVVFLGGTIGNFDGVERRRFLDQVRALLQPGDAFLLGLDLVKPSSELLAAYDDAQGVTAAFNLNVLHVLNRELDAGFDVQSFAHEARWDAELERIEMHLRSDRDQRIAIPGAGMRVELAKGETIRTEISAKFTPTSARRMLRESGLEISRWFTDEAARFAVALATPAEGA